MSPGAPSAGIYTSAPDGYARIEHPAGPLELLLELDRGTENRGRLEDKMER